MLDREKNSFQTEQWYLNIVSCMIVSGLPSQLPPIPKAILSQ